MLKCFDGRTLAAAVNKFAVKFTVEGDARRSWPAGGSLANVDHGLAWLHAMNSGCEVVMTAVCPGVSISWSIIGMYFA